MAKDKKSVDDTVKCHSCGGEVMQVGQHKIPKYDDDVVYALFICPRIENPMAVCVIVNGFNSMTPCDLGEMRRYEGVLTNGESIGIAIQDCPK